MSAEPRITGVERIVVNIPFTPRCQEWNAREVWQWRVCEVIRLTTVKFAGRGWLWRDNSSLHLGTRIGRGRKGVRVGSKLGDLLGDDTLGAGLQMAVYDAVGKALAVPAYRLFNLPKVRDWCPISWWNIDMPPSAFAEEARDAQAAGYTSYKIKARPWWDVYEQMDAISKVSPTQFRLDLDWNQMLLNAGNAAPVLAELDKNERVAIYESPIMQRDVEGHRQLRQKTTRPIALHFGDPPFPHVVRNEACDGFVVSGGVASVVRQGHLAAAFDKPFWLQLVGTGLTTALSAHLGAVLPLAQWPSVNCLNNYSDDLLVEPLRIQGGCVRVPEQPGLGIQIDESALTSFKMDAPHELPRPKFVLTIVWPQGRMVHYAGMKQVWDDCLTGNQPVQDRGVTMEVHLADKPGEWADLYARAETGPVHDQH